MKILKYPVPIDQPEFILNLTPESTILSFQNQNNIPVLWVLSYESDLVIERYFRLFMTGEEFELPINQYCYIGTVQSHNCSFVIHLFEDIT